MQIHIPDVAFDIRPQISVIVATNEYAQSPSGRLNRHQSGKA